MALHHINEILNIEAHGIRQDIVNTARLLNIIIHYELKNENMLSGLCKSTCRYVEKKRKLLQAEKIIFNFFGTVIPKFETGPSAKVQSEKINAFIDLKKEIKPLSSLKKIFLEFDFISWVESKIEGRSFVEMVKEKS